VVEYLSDYHRILDAGNDAYIATAFAAGLNINAEHTLQALCPGHRCPLFSRSFLLFLMLDK